MPRMSSTSAIAGAGFMKCMPTRMTPRIECQSACSEYKASKSYCAWNVAQLEHSLVAARTGLALQATSARLAMHS